MKESEKQRLITRGWVDETAKEPAKENVIVEGEVLADPKPIASKKKPKKAGK